MMHDKSGEAPVVKQTQRSLIINRESPPPPAAYVVYERTRPGSSLFHLPSVQFDKEDRSRFHNTDYRFIIFRYTATVWPAIVLITERYFPFFIHRCYTF